MVALSRLTALRYVQPLREGGSLPAVVDTEDGLFVVKFRGAGQGPKALIAEIVAGELARALDLPVPEIALVDVPDLFGRSEPDPEIQDLLRGSLGVNVGLRYLDGAFNYATSPAREVIDAELAARIVWLDAFLTNPDRTARNVNILVWQRRPYLIDHGAALYAHHDWSSVDEARARASFPLIRHHVLLPLAGDLAGADRELAGRLANGAIGGVLDLVPDDLLRDPLIAGDFPTAAAARDRYVHYLETRLGEPRAFVAEAIAARERIGEAPPTRLSARR